MTEEVRTVAIVGGGFCGTMTAVHLLQKITPFRLRIILIDSKETGRGLAYGTTDLKHLLNVPAGGMSAFENEPNGFVHYLKARYGAASATEFAPRYVYGDYLQQTLRDAVAAKANTTEFSTLCTRVVDVHRVGEKFNVVLGDGSALNVNQIVLALGNAKPTKPHVRSSKPDENGSEFFDKSTRYIDDPWRDDFIERMDWQKPALLIGTGLTAVDMVLKLSSHRFKQKIYAISRHGLQPISHRGLSGKLAAIELPTLRKKERFSLTHITHLLRCQASEAIASERDWRDIIAALRTGLPELWQQLPLAERKRFLRHASVYWDVHRHRLAPSVAASLQDAILSHRLIISAGRISSVIEHADHVDVSVRPRGKNTQTIVKVGAVINCTGPNSNIASSEDDLVARLLKRGFLKQDELRLGVEIEDNYAANSEVATGSIFYVGPWLKAKFWEATAVPELRVHAKNVADNVLAKFENS